jgi:hypothetical protein
MYCIFGQLIFSIKVCNRESIKFITYTSTYKLTSSFATVATYFSTCIVMHRLFPSIFDFEAADAVMITSLCSKSAICWRYLTYLYHKSVDRSDGMWRFFSLILANRCHRRYYRLHLFISRLFSYGLPLRYLASCFVVCFFEYSKHFAFRLLFLYIKVDYVIIFICTSLPAT